MSQTPLIQAHMRFLAIPNLFLWGAGGSQLKHSLEAPGRPPYLGALAESFPAHWQYFSTPSPAFTLPTKSNKSQKSFAQDLWYPLHSTWKNETEFSYENRENKTWYKTTAWQFNRICPRFSIHKHSKSRKNWRKQNYIKCVRNIHCIVTYFRIKLIKFKWKIAKNYNVHI